MQKRAVIYWLRYDLRLHDNLALIEAAKNAVVYPVYIWDEELYSKKSYIGSAARCWLHHALDSINKSLDNKIIFRSGVVLDELINLLEITGATAVYWNRCYFPSEVARDKKIKKYLKDSEIEVKSFNSSLLWEPWNINKQDGTPYKVFTPYYNRGCLAYGEPRKAHRAPKNLCLHNKRSLILPLSSLGLLKNKEWEASIISGWNISEDGAKKNLASFLKSGIDDYKEGRNFPAKKNVSVLSPYIHWGLISVHYIWSKVRAQKQGSNQQVFLSELGWREFSYYLLYHNPKIETTNIQKKFDKYPWVKNNKLLKLWQKAKTGYPLIDAGMRQLYQTGYMHNRMRMVVASFLVKNLGLHWRDGLSWFNDCLFDADQASNSAGWQWVAGCGADAAPFFRIFNPVLQSKKFDPSGEYIRTFVPELDAIPDKIIHAPWEKSEEILSSYGVVLGEDYPWPIVSLSESRAKALHDYKHIGEDKK